MLESLKGSPSVAFATALSVTLLATPLVRRVAWRCGAVAKPDARRQHPEPIALWGGIAIFLGVAAAALLWRQPTWHDVRQLAPSNAAEAVSATARNLHLSTSFIGCGALMLLLGMADDRYELSPLWKLAGQVAIVCVLWMSGLGIRALPFTAGTQELAGPASLALTVLWIVGITNAVNLIDGMDGLASGICAISAASLCAIEVMKGSTWAAAASAALCGASLGFLRYNFHPARIFLGDAGSTLLGFWFACISVAAASKTVAATALILPLLVLGVPVLDTLWAILRRTMAGQPPWYADRGHVHHRLAARGLPIVQAVLLLYTVAAVLGMAAITWVSLRG